MKQDFLDYIQETFKFPPEEMKDFESALSRPLKKTIRVNTNKISIGDFRQLANQHGWILWETPLGKNMFYIDRDDTSLALGHTLEHIAWYFYVQELAASSSPFYMSEDSIDTWEYTILDMSASPGGKTTQLAEYYPNSTIIANEIDKSRMRQLHENLDRLGVKDSFVTNYDGRFFANYPWNFDKILLDAPCSGEWTAYKTDDALKYWNLKNIKRIAKLQIKLLESAFIALKTWGELVYSTCTLNRLENEEIINKLTDKYGDYFNIISLSEDLSKPLIRAWPHKNNTGGFFVVKLRKKAPIEDLKSSNKLQKNTQGFEKVSNTEEKTILNFLEQTFALKLSGKFYTYRNEVYYTEKNIDFFWENFFLYKCGMKIWKLENGIFEPNFFCGINLWKFCKNNLQISTEDLHLLLSWWEINVNNSDGYYQISLWKVLAGIVKVKSWNMKSLLENRFMRK
jgi:16S rRNA (cytosine1407-C5)-methyltransferase